MEIRRVYGGLTLAISKLTELNFQEASALFQDLNIKNIQTINIETMDGVIHKFDVMDYSIDLEDDELASEAERVSPSLAADDTDSLRKTL